MAKSVLYMSMSLDGFITGPDDGPGNGLGNGGRRLHQWLGEPVSKLPRFDPPGLNGIPVVLGDGRRLFGTDRIELELTRVLNAPGVTHLRYRVAT